MNQISASGPFVYRNYTQDQLDAEYNNQAKISLPRFQSFVQDCARLSVEARGRWPSHLDVRYGPHPAQTLDIFLPQEPCADAPVEVFLHGGYWRMFSKDDFSYVANGMAPHGFITVIVNYALVPTVDLDTLAAQCHEAVLWTHANIQRYGGNPNRMFLSGHSAGGHLTAQLLASPWPADIGCPIKAATAISGIYELEPVRLCYLNTTLGFTPETAQGNSPVYRPAPSVPLELYVGAAEGEEYLRQSVSLAQAWSDSPHPPDLHVMDGEDHFSIRAQLGEPASGLVKSMLAQRQAR